MKMLGPIGPRASRERVKGDKYGTKERTKIKPTPQNMIETRPPSRTTKRKNFKKSLLTLANGLKSSTEKKILGPKLRKKTSLKID